jgi:hypothetical protein
LEIMNIFDQASLDNDPPIYVSWVAK